LPRAVLIHGILELNGTRGGHGLIVSIVEEVGFQGSDGAKGSKVDLDPVLFVGRALTSPAEGWVEVIPCSISIVNEGERGLRPGV
tara:strand:+ start:141 stop:395 length:255 start_codon:yes stop_codon:yes gene_type:complete